MIRSSVDSKWQACMRETDAARSWQAGHERTVSQQTRWSRKIQRKAFQFGLQPFTVNPEDLEAHVLAHSSERAISDSAGETWKSGETKTEAQCSCLLPQKPKEIHSASRNEWWLDNSRAQNHQRRMWITDTLSWYKFSPFSGIRVKPKLHRRRRRNFQCSYSRRRSQKLFTRTICYNLASIVENYHGIIEQLQFIDQKQAELQNELYVESKKRHQPYYCKLDPMISGGGFYGMLLLSARWPRKDLLTNGKSNWTKIWGILPGRALFAGKFGKETFWLLRRKNWKVGCRNISQKKTCNRSPDIPWKTENFHFMWQMVQQNYQKETTNSKNPLWDWNTP